MVWAWLVDLLGEVWVRLGGGVGLSWEWFGGYVGRWWLQDGVVLAILGDVGHLGAKVGEQGRKMQQLSEKVGFLEAWRGEGPTQVQAGNLGYPP